MIKSIESTGKTREDAVRAALRELGLHEDEVARADDFVHELGDHALEVEILGEVGAVSDYYNLIHRHNINNYYLCRILSLGDRHLTRDEMDKYHLSTLKLSYDEAVSEYEKRSNTRLGRLIANRELPVLKRARELLDDLR